MTSCEKTGTVESETARASPNVLERRAFLAVSLGLWEAASMKARESRAAQENHGDGQPKFLFLDDRRRRILCFLMARIVPADERSGGALEAKGDRYIDFVLAHADPAFQKTWRDGLDRFGAAIEGKQNNEIDSFLERQSSAEFAPRTEDERFFVYLKTAVAESFYTSQEGIEKELGYRGMTFQMDFPGCAHSEHKVPDGYRPLLRALEKS